MTECVAVSTLAWFTLAGLFIGFLVSLALITVWWVQGMSQWSGFKRDV